MIVLHSDGEFLVVVASLAIATTTDQQLASQILSAIQRSPQCLTSFTIQKDRVT
jgi:hypothetical protein